jgi:hypothetical protein
LKTEILQYNCLETKADTPEKFMQQHVRSKRLLEVADKETRLTEAELEHLEICIECQALYAKSILQVARTRAKDKGKKTVNLADLNPGGFLDRS